MIGRNDELSQIRGLFAIDDAPGLVFAGAAGVGKSRLAQEAAQAAADMGWAVRQISATATSRAIPLGALAHWTDDVGGGASALVRRVVEAMTTETHPSRTVVFVDDAHLLDDLSALVIHQVVHSQAATVVATIRTGEPAPAAVTALWKEGLLSRIDIQPLHREVVDDLLLAAFGARPDQYCGAELWRLTRGNAMFLRKLIESEHQAGRLVSDADDVVRWRRNAAVSETLAELVDAQIGAVANEVRDVVDLVAVAEPLEWHCLRLLADQHALEHAEQRDLIRVSDGDVFVGHPMYGEVRRNRCGTARLRRLRGEIATAMKDGGSPAQVVKRGVLWLESDLPPEPDVLMAAAMASNSLLDFETAVRLFTAATNTGVGAPARIPLAFSLIMTQRGELASEVLDGVEPDEATQSAFINDVIMRASTLMWAIRSPERSRRLIDDALKSASGGPRQQLLVFRAYQFALAARPLQVLPIMAGIDYRDLDPLGATMGYSVEAMAYGELGQPDRAAAMAQESDRVLTTSEQGKMLRQPMIEFHTFALAAAGRLGEAVEVAERHCRSQREEPMRARAVAAEILGMAMYAAGNLSEALRQLPEAIGPELANDFHVVNSFHRFHLLRAQVLARSGDAEGADRALRTARSHEHPAYVYVTSTQLLTEAWLAAARMRPSEARRLARSAAEFAKTHHQFAREVWCLQTAVQFDDTEAAARLLQLSTVVGGPRAAVAARYAAAVDADDAGALDQASLDLETMGDRLAAADAAGQAAASHRRAGRAGSAMKAAARCHRLATECGGASSPAVSAAAFVPPFTSREREIAVMVAQGMSNRQIAEMCSLSVRTIESHVYRASTKAGVAGRCALADVMREGIF